MVAIVTMVKHGGGCLFLCGVGQVTCGHGQLGPVGGTTVVLVASVALCKDVEMCHRAWGEGCVCAWGGRGGGA